MIDFCNEVIKPYSTYCDKIYIDSIINMLNFSYDYNDYIKSKREKLIEARNKSRDSKISLANC